MKRLSIALLCSFMAIGAYANTPATAKKAAATKVSADTKNTVKVIEMKGDESAFRRQIAFTFHDNCGGTLTVYVSAGNSVSTASMATTAYNYACGYANAGGGCF
ncbi:hypothetical protein MKQ70_06300 [Chitinophaga sedimenti]|uniref:hypothetical protein n=1 Tax=Chitinophaga sedimenti TaxID=2033606 RepID=UPI0020053D5B|nr:hypothetical protein [Chitinophaga sedimenti]MCK7554634.1 hypothetical protein [Chitinophaga sedimenti]